VDICLETLASGRSLPQPCAFQGSLDHCIPHPRIGIPDAVTGEVDNVKAWHRALGLCCGPTALRSQELGCRYLIASAEAV